MSTPGIDRDQIALFVDVVFSWCDGLIPLRGLPEKGVTPAPSNDLRWVPAGAGAHKVIATAAEAAASVGRAVYVIPGTVAASGEARAEHVRQMQALVDWALWINETERKLIWSRAARVPWRVISGELGCDRTTAWRRWQLALTKIAARLNAS